MDLQKVLLKGRVSNPNDFGADPDPAFYPNGSETLTKLLRNIVI